MKPLEAWVKHAAAEAETESEQNIESTENGDIRTNRRVHRKRRQNRGRAGVEPRPPKGREGACVLGGTSKDTVGDSWASANAELAAEWPTGAWEGRRLGLCIVWMEGTEGRPRLRLTMLEVDTSSSVRVPSSRRGTALSIATTDPLKQPLTRRQAHVMHGSRIEQWQEYLLFLEALKAMRIMCVAATFLHEPMART